MAENLRARPLYFLTAILTAWTTAQFWLCHNAAAALNTSMQYDISRYEVSHPGALLRAELIPTSLWLRAGLESVAAVLLPFLVALFLVAGGRRWLAGAVAAYPLANVLGGFHDGGSLGLGWMQPSSARPWFATGVLIDTALLLLVVALLGAAMPNRAASEQIRWGFARVIPGLIVLSGWWITRHPSPSAHDWVWLGDAVTFMLVAALLADSELPFGTRMIAIGLVLPLSTGTILNDLIAPHQIGFPATYFMHHTLIALGTALYVLAAPLAFRWLEGSPSTATA